MSIFKRRFNDLVWEEYSCGDYYTFKNAQVMYGDYVLSISTGNMFHNGEPDRYEILIRKNGVVQHLSIIAKDYLNSTSDGETVGWLRVDDVCIFMSRMITLYSNDKHRGAKESWENNS